MTRQARWTVRVLAAVALFMVATGLWMAREAQQEAEKVAALVAVTQSLGLQPLSPPPPQDQALVALGEALFFETALSGNRDVSCATCHDAALGLGDELPLSIGTGGSGAGLQRVAGEGRPPVGRNAPALFGSGLGFMQSMFWDGRVEAVDGGYRTPAGSYLPAGLDNLLAVQAMFPVTFRDEMRGGWYRVAGYSVEPGVPPARNESPGAWHDIDVFGNVNELAAIGSEPGDLPAIWVALMARLLQKPRYASLFGAAYPIVPLEALGFEHAANGLAAYQIETFAAVDTPWDRFLAGKREALAPQAVAGALLFFGEAGCSGCHSGPLLSDGQYHNIGAPQLGPGTDAYAPLDYGRWRVTGVQADRFAFRTPPLRHVAATGPWLHNGAYPSLEEVVRHHLNPEEALRGYDGGHLPPYLHDSLQNEEVTLAAILETLAPAFREPRTLSGREIRQIVAFLESLGTGDIPLLIMPES
jgi:cytochrome c peroxidase